MCEAAILKEAKAALYRKVRERITEILIIQKSIMFSYYKKKKVSVRDPKETTPLLTDAAEAASAPYDDDDDEEEEDGREHFQVFKHDRGMPDRSSIAADRLSMRLLQVDDGDSDAEETILREALDISLHGNRRQQKMSLELQGSTRQAAGGRLCTMIGLVALVFGLMVAALWVRVEFTGPPNQPVGPYELIERQEGNNFFDFYNFYVGPDSVGSNGYIDYVGEDRAKELEIANVTFEKDALDVYYNHRLQRRRRQNEHPDDNFDLNNPTFTEEPFLYLKSAPTEAGPRESIRLEGKQRFNRGLFIIDVRHMPAGCGVWPAFWLTDEFNWPINGEIDIVEGVNYQAEAKTALHTTKGCDMRDVPLGTMTGSWDTAVGIPDKKTGIPDMTQREAKNCYVYDPHQWLNQGCVAIDTDGGSLGMPLNEKGGGVFALEWDPANSHMRTWVFSPHTEVPENLVNAIRTAHKPLSERTVPNPSEWPLPYGYFPIGAGTNCAAGHFRNMRLVLNTAFCGTVAGNRFQIDCENQSKSFKTCNSYIKSQPKELDEAYWKIRGVYVYQRSWQKAWV